MPFIMLCIITRSTTVLYKQVVVLQRYYTYWTTQFPKKAHLATQKTQRACHSSSTHHNYDWSLTKQAFHIIHVA